MPRLRFRKKPRSGNNVEMWDFTHRIKTYLGIPFIHRLTRPPIRRYFDVGWYIPGFLGARLPYRYTTDMAIAPPHHTAKFRVPKYDEFKLGMGFTFARSAKVSLYFVYELGALVMLGAIYATFATDSSLLTIPIVGLVIALVLWGVNLWRLSSVHVMTADDLARYSGIWVNTSDESVEAQDIGAVTAQTPSPKWFWNMFRVMDVTVSLASNADGGKPLYLKKIDNGEEVRDLIIALRSSLESKQKDAADAAERTAEAVVRMDQKLDKLGRIITVGLRGQRDSTAEIVTILEKLLEHFVPAMEILDAEEAPPSPPTKEMPIMPRRPSEPPKGAPNHPDEPLI